MEITREIAVKVRDTVDAGLSHGVGNQVPGHPVLLYSRVIAISTLIGWLICEGQAGRLSETPSEREGVTHGE